MAALVACGGGRRSEPPAIIVDIPDALAALPAGVELFQVAGTPRGVELVVADDGQAVGYTFADGTLSEPAELGPADGYTFRPADVDFDPDELLTRVIDDLDDPLITRVEVLGGPDGVVYSAQIRSAAGGVLHIDLGPDGAVRDVVPVVPGDPAER